MGFMNLAVGFTFRYLCSGRATFRHINNNGKQGREQGLETAAMEALDVSMHYHQCWVLPWAHDSRGQRWELGWGQACKQLNGLTVADCGGASQ